LRGVGRVDQPHRRTSAVRHVCERFGGDAFGPGRQPPVGVRPQRPAPGERPRQVFGDDHSRLVHHGIHRPVGHRADLLFPPPLLPVFFLTVPRLFRRIRSALPCRPRCAAWFAIDRSPRPPRVAFLECVATAAQQLTKLGPMVSTIGIGQYLAVAVVHPDRGGTAPPGRGLHRRVVDLVGSAPGRRAGSPAACRSGRAWWSGGTATLARGAEP
jgi:hypothetical protein